MGEPPAGRTRGCVPKAADALAADQRPAAEWAGVWRAGEGCRRQAVPAGHTLPAAWVAGGLPGCCSPLCAAWKAARPTPRSLAAGCSRALMLAARRPVPCCGGPGH